MLVSEGALKWAMRFYPPFLFQGIWTQGFDKEFKGVQVKICKNLLNSNYNRSIFGGTLFSAADPFYAILFHQILKKQGYDCTLWVKKASIEYLKPGNCNLYFKIALSEEDVQEALKRLNTEGKFIQAFSVKITNKEGVLYAVVHNEIYIKSTGAPKSTKNPHEFF